MLKETFALFQPDLWQKEGLVTFAREEEQKPATTGRAVRKMEKWFAATTAAVALSAVLVGSSPVHTSFATGSAGVARRCIIGMEERVAGAIQGMEVPANYWSDLSKKVATWPRISVTRRIDDDPEPMA